jgi:DNA mismatch repair ATPase MutS
VALIVVLAQIGCFVPAEECFLPVRQRLLSRIGTGDDIENNLSTFLMEMKDAAYICKHSGDKSLVLVDELGRGTANRDGSAIAWGVVWFYFYNTSTQCDAEAKLLALPYASFFISLSECTWTVFVGCCFGVCIYD